MVIKDLGLHPNSNFSIFSPPDCRLFFLLITFSYDGKMHQRRDVDTEIDSKGVRSAKSREVQHFQHSFSSFLSCYTPTLFHETPP